MLHLIVDSAFKHIYIDFFVFQKLLLIFVATLSKSNLEEISWIVVPADFSQGFISFSKIVAYLCTNRKVRYSAECPLRGELLLPTAFLLEISFLCCLFHKLGLP